MAASGQISDVVSAYVSLLRQSLAAPEIAVSVLSTTLTPRDTARPCALVLSPHPDDECLTGLLPLRLLREQGWQVVNVAVTLGSKHERRAERKAELAKACAVLGFECVLTSDEGFSNLYATTRAEQPEAWLPMIARMAEIIAHYQPQAIFMPHSADWNATHTGAHLLAMDALETLPRDFSCAVVQTEYWQPMEAPNVMIGASEEAVATLLSALVCHTGEVARNPYDRRFPAYLIDNVRRGGELLNGKGADIVVMDFAVMYQLGLWSKGKYVPSALKRFVTAHESVGALFE